MRTMTYLEKVEAISEEDREFVRDELVFTVEWLRKRYPFTIREANRFLREMLTVSV